MKKIYLFAIIVITRLACSNNNTKNKDSNSFNDSLNQTNATIDNSIEFLNLFKDVNPKGLHIHTVEWGKDNQALSSFEKGNVIDVKKFSFVNDEKIFLNIKPFREGYGNIHAIGKFEINAQYLGLIVRDRSQYDESLMRLLLWDKKEKKLIDGIDLADSFGDAGWYFDKESWITEYVFDEKLCVVSRQKDCIPEDEEITKFSYTDSLQLNTFDINKFKISKLPQKDTIKYKLKLWIQ